MDKKYCYHLIDIDEKIYANNGAEAMEEYSKKYSTPYEGTIELTVLATGETNMMYPIKLSK